MSTDFVPKLVKDSRIDQITDVLPYAVYSGAASNTYQRFPAVSSSSSSISFNVQIPSESIVVSRDVLLEANVRFRVEITDVPQGSVAFQYGESFCFQAFPLNSLFTTLQATINNTSVSINLKDIKDGLLRMVDTDELGKYQGMTPYLRDKFYQQYNDGKNSSVDVFSGYKNSDYDQEHLPRGCHPLISYNVSHQLAGGGTDHSVMSTNAADRWVIDIEAQFTEPLFLSPFIFGGSSDLNNQGFVGLNSLNIVANVDAGLSRFCSFKDNGYTINISLQNNPFTASLLLNFLSTQPTDLVKAKNIVPYMDYPRYLTSTTNLAAIPFGQSQTITCQNIQLSQVPDLFLIFVRPFPITQTTFYQSASFLPITNISVNFNNSSGLLSSCTRQDLWRISRRNGLKSSWIEFSGMSSTLESYALANISANPGRYPTTGSMIVLNPALDLSLPSYLSCGSLGQYSFQINVTVENFYRSRLGGIAVQPEVVVVCCNSGLFTTISGTSSVYTGILSKQMVLDVQQSGESVDSSQIERIVGGSLSNRVATSIKGMMPKIKSVQASHLKFKNPSKLDLLSG